MEKLYNAMLRRYGSVRAVSQPLENALIAMLPMEYRMSRAINKVRIGYWFECWKLLPADWQRGGARTQTRGCCVAAEYTRLHAKRGKRNLAEAFDYSEQQAPLSHLRECSCNWCVEVEWCRQLWVAVLADRMCNGMKVVAFAARRS